MSSSTLPPAESRNRFQRWYFGWAEKHYARMSPSMREQVELIDSYLYTARGAGVWVGLGCALMGLVLVLHDRGASWLESTVLSALLIAALFASTVAGWLLPERYSGRKLRTIVMVMMLGTYAGGLGTMFGKGRFSGTTPDQWPGLLADVFWKATPFQLIAGLMMVVLVWASSTARRVHLNRELARTRLEQERDAAAAQLTQARLSLLQAQIQPHFLFNTLAALQHWVDTGDARAAPLLRALTAFLRGSTELMLRAEVRLDEECALARHYLEIMCSRLGQRLRYTIDIAPDCADQMLPPGLVLTLVENAVAHGIEPQLRGGEVRIQARRIDGVFELHVLDDGAGPAIASAEQGPGVEHTGVGLANSRERLRHRFGDAAQLLLQPRCDGPGADAWVRLPRNVNHLTQGA